MGAGMSVPKQVRKPLTAKYIKERTEINERGCWVWTGAVNNNGYPRGMKHSQPHREAYVLYKGPIPEGMQLDHRCHNHACCNPDHLEPCSQGENLFRQASYRRGQMSRKHLRVARMLHKMVGQGKQVLEAEVRRASRPGGRIGGGTPFGRIEAVPRDDPNAGA